jgi:alkylation response protein AidB-like acyl-CoA dehydrogenase
VDFRLTDDQLALQAAVRELCAREYAFERLAAMDGHEVDRDAWAALGALGVFAVRTDPADDGLGLGWMDTAVVYEVLGSHLVPGPLVWSQLAVEHVPGAAAGTRVVGGLDLTDTGTGPLLLEHAGGVDAVVVVRPDAVSVVDADEWGDVEPLPPLDPLTPVGRIPDIRDVPAGRTVADADAAAATRRHGAVLTSALMVGIADRALEQATAYAMERHQFGRPIGSFQAIQHLLADMYVRTMLARSATYAAAAILDDPDAGDVDLAVSSAKVVAGDAAMANARACIQAHGGLGFTWEMMPHYLLKRTWVLEHAFSTGVRHTEQIAATLGGNP